MKTLCGLFVVIVAIYATALYGEEKSVSVEFTPTVKSKYVDDDGVVYYDGVVAQADLTISWNNGVYLGIWQSRGLRGERLDQIEDETDYRLGWAGDIGGLTVDFSGAYYDFSPIMKDTRNAIYSFAVDVRPSGDRRVTPFASVEIYRTRDDADYEGGTRVGAGIEWSNRISRADIEQSLSVTYEDGAFGLGKAFVGIYRADLAWQKGRMTILLPSVALYHPFKQSDGQKTELVVGAGARWSF